MIKTMIVNLGPPDVAGTFMRLMIANGLYSRLEIADQMEISCYKAIEVKLVVNAEHSGYCLDGWREGGFYNIGEKVSVPTALHMLKQPLQVTFKISDNRTIVLKRDGTGSLGCHNITAEDARDIREHSDAFYGPLPHDSSTITTQARPHPRSPEHPAQEYSGQR